MPVTVSVKPELLRWACERAGPAGGDLYQRYPQLSDWISGEDLPTLRQLEDFAKSAHVAVGFLFLPEPPIEVLPIKDLRTKGGKAVRSPSPNLLDTLYACQERQRWFREHATRRQLPRCEIVRIATLSTPPEKVASELEGVIEFGSVDARSCTTPDDAFRMFIDRIEDNAGVLVMTGGQVGGNTNRLLDPDEFRGFALVDDIAPLVFVNGGDAKTARMFTLAHELAHLCLGESALSNVSSDASGNNPIEIWCNQVAAAYLVPAKELIVTARKTGKSPQALANEFKVSNLVMLRRMYDMKLIDRTSFQSSYSIEMARYNPKDKSKKDQDSPKGGNFYASLRRRVSGRFAAALVGSTLEGHTLYNEAYSLLGIKSHRTFDRLSKLMGYVE